LRRNYPPLKAWIDARSDLISHIPPKAGAIAWAGLRDGRNTARMLDDMKKRGVLMVSGEQMGMTTFFRVGFGSHPEQLAEALERIDSWLHQN
jgi:DNA-binding transcriptional MocR family regulator